MYRRACYYLKTSQMLSTLTLTDIDDLKNLANKQRLCLFFEEKNLQLMTELRNIEAYRALQQLPICIYVNEVLPPALTEVSVGEKTILNQQMSAPIILPQPNEYLLKDIDIYINFPESFRGVMEPFLPQSLFTEVKTLLEAEM